MVVTIKPENNTYIMTATVAPICCGFMFLSVFVVVFVVVFFGLCVVKLENHTYIMTIATICYSFMYLSDFVDGFVVLCLAVHRLPRRCQQRDQPWCIWELQSAAEIIIVTSTCMQENLQES